MDFLFKAYDAFIGNFATQYQGLISLGLLAIIIIVLFHLVRKNILWLVLLVIFVPASLPILRKIGEGILLFLQYILGRT